jgi:type IV pilus biogenesis protein CpaD/CtpE
MKPVLASILLGLLAACANPNETPAANPGPTKTEIKARDDFAKSLPKPSDR